MNKHVTSWTSFAGLACSGLLAGCETNDSQRVHEETVRALREEHRRLERESRASETERISALTTAQIDQVVVDFETALDRGDAAAGKDWPEVAYVYYLRARSLNRDDPTVEFRIALMCAAIAEDVGSSSPAQEGLKVVSRLERAPGMSGDPDLRRLKERLTALSQTHPATYPGVPPYSIRLLKHTLR